MDNELLTAALIGALGGSIITVLVMHLANARIIRQEFSDIDIAERAELNGIDLFAEHYRMQRKAGESDVELVERVNREMGDRL